MCENLQDHPFCDLWAVDAGGVRDGHICIFPDGSVDDLVCTCAKEMEKFEVLLCMFDILREGSQGDEDCSLLP